MYKLPSQCWLCQQWSKQLICPDCEQEFIYKAVNRCTNCAIRLATSWQFACCAQCLTKAKHFDYAFCAVDYLDPWRNLIAKFKFSEQFNLATLLAFYLHQNPAVLAALQQADYVVAIPLSQQRLTERGYNQSLLLAKALSQHKTILTALKRVKHSKPLHQLSKAQRQLNIKGAFKLNPSYQTQLAHKHLILVDDVMTSAATLNEAARVLKKAKVKTITAIVFARTP